MCISWHFYVLLNTECVLTMGFYVFPWLPGSSERPGFMLSYRNIRVGYLDGIASISVLLKVESYLHFISCSGLYAFNIVSYIKPLKE